MPVQFKDNSVAVKAAMKEAKKKALTAIGEAAVEVTVDYMNKRYPTRIYQTGDLQRDVNFGDKQGNRQVNTENWSIDVGNSLEYAVPVSLGTSKMKGRNYLYDAITENTDIWKEIAEEYIGDEMK